MLRFSFWSFTTPVVSLEYVESLWHMIWRPCYVRLWVGGSLPFFGRGEVVRENSWPRQRSDLLVNDLSRSRYRGADAGAGVQRAVSWDAEVGADV